MTIEEENRAAGARTASAGRPIDERFLRASFVPFAVAFLAVGGILGIYILNALWEVKLFGAANADDSPLWRFLIPNAIPVTLSLIALVSAYIGYRLIAAAGATAGVVIPANDYDLLAPLVSEGKAESIDQYVRLSSLTKFTGTFTQLGLTGLPLATIGLTLLFSALTLWDKESFLDLTKLTLGAFIGSFVQRTVERRAASVEAETVNESGRTRSQESSSGFSASGTTSGGALRNE